MNYGKTYTDKELVYAAYERCACGHGIAHPKDCSIQDYWDCSAILKGVQNIDETHTDKLPFVLNKIKVEHPERGTTRIIEEMN